MGAYIDVKSTIFWVSFSHFSPRGGGGTQFLEKKVADANQSMNFLYKLCFGIYSGGGGGDLSPPLPEEISERNSAHCPHNVMCLKYLICNVLTSPIVNLSRHGHIIICT